MTRKKQIGLDWFKLQIAVTTTQVIGFALLVSPLINIGSTVAQTPPIVAAPDGTGTNVSQIGNRFDIQGGQPSADRANLFHSFTQFGLNTRDPSSPQIANFLSTPQIQNILVRVSGGKASTIDGVIQVTGGNSNLFLMNPAGIVFGANASLNVPGSFTATTANGIGFGSGWFSASGTNDYASLIGAPNSFAFTMSQPGAIINTGNLTVNPQQSLILVGGTIVSTKPLSAQEGGQIAVAAVPGGRFVRLSQSGSLLSLDIQALPLTNQPQPWTLPILSLPELLTGGQGSNATGLVANTDGSIQLIGSGVPIRVGAVVLGDLTTTSSTGSGGSIFLTANGDITTGTINSATTNGLNNQRNGGKIILNTSNGSISTGAIFSNGNGYSDGFGPGGSLFGRYTPTGGDIRLNATNNISTGEINSSTLTAVGGTISLNTSNGSIFTGAISSAGSGYRTTVNNGTVVTDTLVGGEIDLNAANSIITGEVNSSALIGSGNSVNLIARDGGIKINGGVKSSGGFGAYSPAGIISYGAGGAVNLHATGNIIIQNSIDSSNGGLVITNVSNEGSIQLVSTLGAINVGSIITGGFEANQFLNIAKTGNVTLSAEGDIVSGFVSTRGIDTNAAGNVRFMSRNGTIQIDGINTGSSSNNGGAISITAGQNIVLTASLLSSAGLGTSDPFSRFGNSGPIVLKAGNSIITKELISSAFYGNGGSITIDPPNNIQVTYIDAQGGTNGRGGNVSIETSRFFQATGSFLDQNGTVASISTAGGQPGSSIVIKHGGYGSIPFTIGNLSENGTVGAITTGLDNIIPSGKYFVTYRQTASSGDIQITTLEAPQHPEIKPLEPLDDKLPEACAAVDVVVCAETLSSLQYDRYTEHPDIPIKSLSQIQSELRDIERKTKPGGGNVKPDPEVKWQGIVKPALIYAFFTPVPTNPQEIVQQLKPEQRLTGADQPLSVSPDASAAEYAVETTPQGPHIRLLKQPAQEKVINFPFQVGCQVSQDPEAIAEAQKNCQLQLVLVTSEGQPILRLSPNSSQRSVLKAANLLTAAARNCSPSQAALTNCRSQLAQNSEQFYAWLVEPLKADLERQGINNLVFILDKGLRTLPLAALRKPQPNPSTAKTPGYLVETYSIGLMPSMSLTDTHYTNLKDRTVLTMGASTFKALPGEEPVSPLPFVREELASIQRTYQGGPIFMDENFTRKNLEQERKQFELIHLATHGSFEEHNQPNSFIRLYDTKFAIKEIADFNWRNPPVQLLVLSACQTAVGDDQLIGKDQYQAELGFAGLTVQAGVNASIASLWSVADGGTSVLMTEFYKWLKKAPVKAVALQQAQLALINGSWKPQLTDSPQTVPTMNNPSHVEDQKILNKSVPSDLSDPYYWSGFTMIGNPW
ncbi:MAG: CHAT domain-containing protein (plasmid) [Leptolyngbya sp. BL-A-14]